MFKKKSLFVVKQLLENGEVFNVKIIFNAFEVFLALFFQFAVFGCFLFFKWP